MSFGATGDLAYMKIMPALQALSGSRDLDMPIVGIARPDRAPEPSGGNGWHDPRPEPDSPC